MPTIYSVGPPSQLKDVLGGDAHRQIDAFCGTICYRATASSRRSNEPRIPPSTLAVLIANRQHPRGP